MPRLTRRQLRELHGSLEFDTTDREAISDALYRYKVKVYENTLTALAEQMGRAELVNVTSQVRRKLRAEADESAGVIVTAYNRDLRSFIAQHVDDDPVTILQRVDAWARNRAEARREKIAVTETYGPHADALAAVFLHNDMGDALFDFGGHGDADPACEICQVLKETSPHPVKVVVKIGSPHPNCRQTWHPVIDPGDLPPFFSLEPADVAGIVGRQSLIQRVGGLKQAVRYVRRITRGR